MKLFIQICFFSQDAFVSDNLNGKISGKIRVHSDLVPIIDESEINLDFAVYNGTLINFAPMKALEDFFKDKNLQSIAFDTLQNNLKIKNGAITVPSMTINTSLGFLIIEGSQDKLMNMNYLIRVPLRMVTQLASQKLFKRKKEDIDPEQEDEIIYHDPNRKTSFINLRITGTPENYSLILERKNKAKSKK